MNKFFLLFTALIFCTTTSSFANSDQVITLKDGSQFKGTLAGIENGIYTVKTPIIGDVHVAASDVASITNGAAAVPTSSAPAVSSPNLDQEVASQQQKLMANPQAMADLQKMAQDPEIMQALSDPALVQAVTSHDYQAVQSNPKIQELMQNPRMRELLQQIAASQQQQNTSSH